MPSVPLIQVPHPSSRDAADLGRSGRRAITQFRGIVTPDPGGDNTGANYGTGGSRSPTTRRSPRRDLPFGVPPWFGDDAWGRKARPRHNNSVERPGSDLRHKLVWQAPKDQP